jgi:predicted Fe-Mo cluster-binding NifX family protein
MMKTAIPTLQGKIAAEGHLAAEYTMVSGENDAPETIQIPVEAGQTVPAIMGMLKVHGVERILAGNLDQAYLGAAEMAGFQVFYGASGSIADALNLISLGILDSMANGCGCSGGGCSSGGCGGSCGTSEEKDTAGCGSGCGCGSR